MHHAEKYVELSLGGVGRNVKAFHGAGKGPPFFMGVRFFILSVSNGQCIIPDMKPREFRDLERYLTHLRTLPFVRRAAVRNVGPDWGPYRPDAVLTLRAPQGSHEFFAPYVGQQMGRHLDEHGMNYVDAAGNCRLRLGDDHVVIIEGQRPAREAAGGRGMGAAGFQVLFAVLAKPDLLTVPIRTLADAAGVGKTAAADTIVRLEKEGLVAAGRQRRRLLQPKMILDRWLVGYATAVRPRLFVGRYRTGDPDPAALENRIEKALGEMPAWAWGGRGAAMRLTKHYRGEETVLHVESAPLDLPKRLRALPAHDGPLTILRVPGKIGFEGVLPRTVHPLLVFTELLTTGNERAREAAQEIRERYLKLHA
jgi:hypothetical protein